MATGPQALGSRTAGADLYRDNDLDRGHLVRRSDPVWGTAEEAAQANVDTFHYTNAAPQQAEFNEGKELWVGLEDYLLENAADYDRQLVVLTGPVLDTGDPVYRGVQVPLRFWKVAGLLVGGQLASTAYVLDQSPPDPDQLRRNAAMGELTEAPPLGPFRTFQVPVRDVVDLTGLDLGPLPDVDLLLPKACLAPAGSRGAWRPLTRLDDIAYCPPALADPLATSTASPPGGALRLVR